MIVMGLYYGKRACLKSVLALAGTMMVVILGFREYSLVYLNTLVMGALLLGIFVSMQMIKNERAVE